MTDVSPDIVPGMSEAIERRRRELRIPLASFIEQSGLTREAIRRVRRGERRQYHERTTEAVTQILRWTPDSLDRLLRGESPVELDDDAVPPVSDLASRVDKLEADYAALRAEHDELYASVAEGANLRTMLVRRRDRTTTT